MSADWDFQSIVSVGMQGDKTFSFLGKILKTVVEERLAALNKTGSSDVEYNYETVNDRVRRYQSMPYSFRKKVFLGLQVK